MRVDAAGWVANEYGATMDFRVQNHEGRAPGCKPDDDIMSFELLLQDGVVNTLQVCMQCIGAVLFVDTQQVWTMHDANGNRYAPDACWYGRGEGAGGGLETVSSGWFAGCPIKAQFFRQGKDEFHSFHSSPVCLIAGLATSGDGV